MTLENVVKRAMQNLDKWSQNAYVSGGADNTVNSTATIEDLKVVQMFNPNNTTLNNVIKKLTNLAHGQDMFVDQKQLNSAKQALSNLTLTNK